MVHRRPDAGRRYGGFGLVWRGDVVGSPGFAERLGWALAPEFGQFAIL